MDTYKRYIAEQAKIFKALGHPSRLLMIDAITKSPMRELCVCELQALVGADMSTVSKHLSVLKDAGVVRIDKRGTNIYYSLSLCCLDSFLECTADAVKKRICDDLSLIK